MKDTNFDGIASHFEEEIYGSSKGYIRLQVLVEDLLSEIPQIERGNLDVLDASGGAGQMAVRVAQLGNNIILCDPSREMLDMAEQATRTANVSRTITTINSSIQDLRGRANRRVANVAIDTKGADWSLGE
ncbi:hypothetical protein BH24ACT22_BH24ACT22_15480 [soil metagenome]